MADERERQLFSLGVGDYDGEEEEDDEDEELKLDDDDGSENRSTHGRQPTQSQAAKQAVTSSEHKANDEVRRDDAVSPSPPHATTSSDTIAISRPPALVVSPVSASSASSTTPQASAAAPISSSISSVSSDPRHDHDGSGKATGTRHVHGLTDLPLTPPTPARAQLDAQGQVAVETQHGQGAESHDAATTDDIELRLERELGAEADFDEPSAPSSRRSDDGGAPVSVPQSWTRHLVSDRSLLSLPGLPVGLVVSLLALAIANISIFALSNDHSGCSSLASYVLLCGCLSGAALAIVPIMKTRMAEDSQWRQSFQLKCIYGGLMITWLFLMIYTIVCLVLLGNGLCARNTIIRQMAMVDAVIVLTESVLVLLYVALRWLWPAVDLWNDATLWSRKHAMVALIVCAALFIANIAAIATIAHGRKTYHRAVVEWSECASTASSKEYNCTASALPQDRIPNVVCLDETGHEAEEVYCSGLPDDTPLMSPSPCPILPCLTAPPPSYRFRWVTPPIGSCQRQCNPDYAGPIPLTYQVSCINLLSRSAVSHHACYDAGQVDPNLVLPPLECPPNPCWTCVPLYRYSQVYAAATCILLAIIAADLYYTHRRSVPSSSSLSTTDADLSELTTGPLSDEDFLRHKMDEVTSSSSSSSTSPPSAQHSRSPIQRAISRYPRLSFIILFATLLSFIIGSLIASAQFINEQCHDFLPVAIPNVILTLSVGIVSIVALIRHRQQVWHAVNPFEATTRLIVV